VTASAEQLFARVERLAERLSEAGIWNEKRVFRGDGITILAHVPGQYWEIDLLVDGRTDVEVYRSAGDLGDESMLDRLIMEWAEPKE
jgi:hypothetical protein